MLLVGGIVAAAGPTVIADPVSCGSLVVVEAVPEAEIVATIVVVVVVGILAIVEVVVVKIVIVLDIVSFGTIFDDWTNRCYRPYRWG